MRIDVEDVKLGLGGVPVLRGASLCVPDGAFVSVLGASGAGKSTLLRVICGLTPQDAGTVCFDGESVDGVAPQRRRVAMVYQDARLFPNMSVRDNVAFPLRMQGVRRAERCARAEALLAEVRLAGMGGRRVGELSGGQRQRVALARALAGEPRAVLLDEPFSGLDESLRDEMRALVLELHETRGTTMVMVTHSAVEALVMSDRVAYLEGGRVVQEGTPREILLSPASEGVAGSLGGTLALEGEVRAGSFVRGRLAVPAPGVAEGPATLLRTSDGAVRVYARQA